MSREQQPELDLGLPEESAEPGCREPGLMFVGADEAALSPAQKEFNTLLGRLEKAREKQERQRRHLDELLSRANAEVLPLIAEFNGTRRDILFEAVAAFDSIKFSQRRREALEEEFLARAQEVLGDPLGLGEEEVGRLVKILERFEPEVDEEETREAVNAEFDMLRAILESEARQQGIDLDLGGLDPNGDPEEFERQLEERLRRADDSAKHSADAAGPATKKAKRRRKPTKAQIERQRRQEEIEEAKRRDVKTLFKQLAKVLHPDIEPDPELKALREGWMQRLNAAFERRDLREMLTIEMEWLGAESSHLAGAGDEKLRIYTLVLKEQVSDLHRETRELAFGPEYATLSRFGNPNALRKGDLAGIRRELTEAIADELETLDMLRSGKTVARRLLNEWAAEILDGPSDSFIFGY